MRLQAWLRRGQLLALSILLSAAAQAPAAPSRVGALSALAMDTWNMASGLPQQGAQFIEQDADGFLWLGGMEGLVRFDGQRFRSYTSQSHPGLPSRWITGLQRDRQGRLWVGTAQGLVSHHNGLFLPPPGQRQATTIPSVLSLALDQQGQLLVAGPQAIHRLDPVFGPRQLTAIPHTQLPVHMASSPEGLWLGVNNQLWQLRDGRLHAIALPQRPGLGISRLFLHAGQLWLATNQGLYRRHGQAWQALSDHRLMAHVRSLGDDGQGGMLAITPSQLLRLDGSGRVIDSLPLNGKLTGFTQSYLDSLDNLWLTGLNQELHRLWPGPVQLIPPPPADSHNDNIAHWQWSVARTEAGQLVSGGNFGLAVLGPDHRQQLRLPVTQTGEIYSLYADGPRLWAGTRTGLSLYEHLQRQPLPAAARLAGESINVIARLPRHGLLVGSDRGLYHFDAQLQVQPITTAEAAALPAVRSLMPHQDQSVWIGTEHGLFTLPAGSSTARPVPMPAGTHWVAALLQLPDGRVLMAEYNLQGIWLLDHGHWQPLGVAQGLPRNLPFDLQLDAAGTVWVHGQSGLYHFRPEQIDAHRQDPTRLIQVHNVVSMDKQRLGGQAFGCCAGLGSGRLLLEPGQAYAVTALGLLQIDTRQPAQALPPPRIRIDGIHTRRGWHSASGQQLDFPAGTRDLQVEVAMANLDPVLRPQLFYRLLGYQPQWQALQADQQGRVHYTNLPAGQYQLEVRSNLSGADSAGTDRIQFQIAPYWFQSLPFRAMLALLLGGVTLFAVGAIHRIQRRRRQRLEQLVEQRTQDLHDANRQLEQISCQDPLTGLHNRRYISRQIPQDLARPQPHCMQASTLFVLMDIDHFKTINDRHGHAAGDQVLCEVASRLRRQLRPGDHLARWGGEEFLMVIHQVPRDQHAALAERLRTAIAHHPVVLDGLALNVTISLGLAELVYHPEHPASWHWEQSITVADIGLYAAKRHGRNGWAIHRLRTRQPLDQRHDLLELLQAGQLELELSRPAG